MTRYQHGFLMGMILGALLVLGLKAVVALVGRIH